MDTEKKTRNKGAFEISYVAVDGNSHDRIPKNVQKVRISERASGKHADYDLNELPEHVSNQLMAAGFARFVAMSARNHSDGDGSNAIETTNATYAQYMTGQLYLRDGSKSGAKGVRKTVKVDAMYWTPILQDWFKRKESEKNKPQEVKDANVARFIAKLEAMTGHDRNKFVATVSANDVVFADCKQRYDLKLQAAKLKADGNVSFDFDDVLSVEIEPAKKAA